MNSSLTTIRLALNECLKQITLANGYRTEVNADLVSSDWSANNLNRSDDEAFPRIITALVDGNLEQGIGGLQSDTIEGTILLFVKQTQPDQDPLTMIEALVEDVRRVLTQNDSLGGTVTDARVTKWVTDGGALSPEGGALVRIVAEQIRDTDQSIE